MITGYGVAQSIKHYYSIWAASTGSATTSPGSATHSTGSAMHSTGSATLSVVGKKVIVQGWGNVGSAGAYYLSQQGAKIVGIIDRVGGLINEEGFSFEEIKQLFLNKNGNELVHSNLLSYEEVNSKIWDIHADVFIPDFFLFVDILFNIICTIVYKFSYFLDPAYIFLLICKKHALFLLIIRII